MRLEIEATYANGVLTPNQQLPLQEGQRVKITLEKPSGRSRSVIQWKGSVVDLDYLIMSEDNDPVETP